MPSYDMGGGEGKEMGLPMKKPEGGGEGTEAKMTTLPLMEYPELEGAKEGDSVEGKFKGTISSIDDANAKISYSEVKLSVGNQADRAMKDMMKQPGDKEESGKPPVKTQEEEL